MSFRREEEYGKGIGELGGDIELLGHGGVALGGGARPDGESSHSPKLAADERRVPEVSMSMKVMSSLCKSCAESLRFNLHLHVCSIPNCTISFCGPLARYFG